ncbi:hypothetical protein Vadar_001295 [Vaccinium darrowii]|uniref:Uncharacterized protein n=1 Tax=Vaccinium darrowii TaxID=229202 RepID=A0ACB7XVU7_9ERIC|nr:hypothetical protein Vadar_001295 [Vaccinium darrowii]
MICFYTLVSVDQQIDMSNSVNSINPCSKLRQKKAPNSANYFSIPACQQSRFAAIDVLILIAVIAALGFLLIPHVKLFTSYAIEFVRALVFAVKMEVSGAPVIYGCLGLSILCTVVAVLAITVCMSRKCGRPGCRGLRKAAKFDIQLETEEFVKNSSSFVGKDGVKKGVFKLALDHHIELESELKKMAPPNGKAVLVFKGRCGCSVGRMEVPGPKKPRKVKK